MAGRPLAELLVERGIFESVDIARRWILARRVLVDGRRDAKPGERFPADAAITVKGVTDRAYVTRGGLKLEAALAAWDRPVAGRAALDIGCSVGGFTDCLLQHGAARVYAVDVGQPRLSPKLRADPRVRVFEQCNVATLPVESFDPPPELAVVDVSYLAASGAVADTVRQCPSVEWLIVLLKPLYELGRGGADLSEADYDEAVRLFTERVERLGLRVDAVLPSPLEGLRGAREYLVQVRR